MRLLFLLPLALTPLVAQQAPAEEAAEAPTPVVEQRLHTTLDFGFRWITTPGGDFNTYRSLVNLGEGPRLLGSELTLDDPRNAVLNRLVLQMHSWGGDPYNTLRLNAEKNGVYRLHADYRNILYFNYLPSFANPGPAQPGVTNQRAFDQLRRNADIELELRPGKRIVPYFGFNQNTGSGRGITPYVATGNEFPVATEFRDASRNYRGGVRIESRWAHLTLEQGGTTFRDDQRVFTRDPNRGNRTTPILGVQTALNDLEQAYGVRGDGYYSKGLLTFTPSSWFQFYGQFLFSQPSIDTSYAENARGLFFLGGTTFFNGLDGIVLGLARQPHTAATTGFELRPHRRIRILESWTTDRFHNASSALLRDQILLTGTAQQLREIPSLDRLVVNYNRQQIEGLIDVTRKLTLRGGHRYVWGDVSTRAPQLSPDAIPGTGELRMHVGLGGVTYRATQRAFFNVDFEGSPGDRNYFRTSLQDYRLARARARIDLRSDLQFHSNFRHLDNRNPAPGIEFHLNDTMLAGGFHWLPGGGNRVTLFGEYGWSRVTSDIEFIVPSTFELAPSFYRDFAHVVTAFADIRPMAGSAGPRFQAGGSYFRSSGSRPTSYYQPLIRFAVAARKGVEPYVEWRWFGFTQAFYLFEGFRTHQLIAGLRLSH
jgi:hypothetical protein